MGLDWNPIGKSKAGHDEEFEQLFNLLGEKPVGETFVGKFKRLFKSFDRETATKRWFELQISPFVTVQAPQVGFEPRADEWAKARFRESPAQVKTEAQFLQELKGYHVVALAPQCDGIPYYSNGSFGYVELYSFRAQFIINDCIDIVGEPLLEKCYQSCLAQKLALLGSELRACANGFSAIHGVPHVKSVRELDAPEGSPESKAHILFAAPKWCEYWSSRGHGLEAYF